MRSTHPARAAAALALLVAPATAAPKNIIFFGNSFSGSGGGVHLLVRDIATAAGHDTPHVFGRIIGGQSLSWHAATAAPFIDSGIPAGEHWDAVVLQEFSTRPTTHPTDGNVPAFLQATQGLYGAVLDHSPGAQAVLFETWARAPGHPFYPSIWGGPADMQAELRMYYHQADAGLDALGRSEVAPVGDAFEAAGFDTSLYAGDLYHASDRGALLISLVLYGSIYDDPTLADIDLSGVGAGLALTPADRALAVALAEAVLVPAPPGAMLLGAAGVLAARRRR